MFVETQTCLYMVMACKRRFQLEMEVTTQISILQHLSGDARILRYKKNAEGIRLK